MRLTHRQTSSSIIPSKPALVLVVLLYTSVSFVSADRRRHQTAGDVLQPDRGQQARESPSDHGRRRHHRSHPDETEDSCSAVVSDLRELLRGHPHDAVPRKKIIASEQSFCLSGVSPGDSKTIVNASDHLRGGHHHHHKQPMTTTSTCCTLQMESLLLDISVEEIRARVHGVNKNLKAHLNEAAKSFKKRVENSLDTMRQRTSVSLVNTFHLPSQHVDEMIAELISDLRSHLIDDGRVTEDGFSFNLEKFFDSLFSVSYYHLLHSSISTRGDISPELKQCTSKIRQTLSHKPFGETAYFFVSVKMSTLIARGLVSILEVAYDVVNVSESIPFQDSCSRDLLKMSYCSICLGYGVVRPCLNYCQNVVAACLANLIELESVWKDLGLTARDVISNTKNSFNFGTMAEAFPARIEQAMINLMMGVEHFYNQVEASCRNASSPAATFEKLKPSDFEMLKAKAMQINETKHPRQQPQQQQQQRLYKRQLPLYRSSPFGSDRHQHETDRNSNHQESGFFSEVDSVFNPSQSLWGHSFNGLTDQICRTLSPSSSSDVPLTGEHRKHQRNPGHEQDKKTISLPVDHAQCWNGSAIGKYKRPRNFDMHHRHPDMHHRHPDVHHGHPREPLLDVVRHRIDNLTSQLYRKFMGPGLNHGPLDDTEHYGSGDMGSGDDFNDDDDDYGDEDDLIDGLYSSGSYGTYDNSGAGYDDTNETIIETTPPVDRRGGDFDFPESTVRLPPSTPSPTDASTTSPTTKATVATIATARPTGKPGSAAGNSLVPGQLLMLLLSLLATVALSCDCSRLSYLRLAAVQL